MAIELLGNTPTLGTATAITTLSANLSSSATTMTAGAPPTYLQGSNYQFRILIDQELMIGSYSSATWTLIRGNNLASPDTCTNAAHTSGANVYVVASAGSLQQALAPSITTRTVSGTTDTPTVTDVGNIVECTSSSAVTVTLPTFATSAIPYGGTNNSVIEYFQAGTGAVSFVGAPTTVSQVQQGDSGNSGLIASGSSWNLPGNVTAGNMVLVFVRNPGTAILTSASGNFGGTWTIGDTIATAGGNLQAAWCFGATGGGKAITLANSGPSTYIAWAAEYSGVGSVTSIAGASATSSAPSLSATPTYAGSPVVVALNTGGTVSTSPASPWALYNTGGWSLGYYGLELAYQSTGSAVTATWGLSASVAWVTLGVVLNPTPSVTIETPSGFIATSNGQYSPMRVRYRALNTVALDGFLAA